jgi:hypothetical protein
MRRTVLTAAPETRRRFLPALAFAGAMAAALLIAFFALKPRPAEAPPPRIAAVAGQPAAPPEPRLPIPPLPRTAPVPAEQAANRKMVHRRHRTRALPEATAALASLGPSTNAVEDTGTRQVEFSAPGGTRIIWILKSGKASR